MDIIPLVERPVFKHDGRTFEVVRFAKPNKIQVWEKFGEMGGNHYEEGKVLLAETLPVEILQQIDIWKDLSTEVKDQIEGKHIEKKEVLIQRLEVARKVRRKKYENIPTELTCSCGASIKIQASVLCKRVEERKILLADYVKGYKCQKCCPTKGRRKS